VQIAAAMEVAERRAELRRETGEVTQRERSLFDQACQQRLAAGLEHYEWDRILVNLIRPDDVGMSHRQKELTFGHDATPVRGIRAPVGPQDFYDAAGLTLLAPRVVHIAEVPTPKMSNRSVPADERGRPRRKSQSHAAIQAAGIDPDTSSRRI